MRRLNCEEAVREFVAYLDRALSGESLEALESHLRECLDCCERLQFGRQIDDLVKARLDEGAVSADVERRLREGLAKMGIGDVANS